MARTIPLNKDGYFAVVDDADYESLKGFKWFVVHDKNTHYAIRTYRVNKRRFTLSMHCHILSAGEGFFTDHRNGNGLNCQRINLRSATRNQNAWNRGMSKNNKSGVKGVCWNQKKKAWIANITLFRKQIHVGQFVSLEAAASARKSAEERLHGEFSRKEAA